MYLYFYSYFSSFPRSRFKFFSDLWRPVRAWRSRGEMKSLFDSMTSFKIKLRASGLRGWGCSTEHAVLSIISCVTRGLLSVMASQSRPWSDPQSHCFLCDDESLHAISCLMCQVSSCVHAALNTRIAASYLFISSRQVFERQPCSSSSDEMMMMMMMMKHEVPRAVGKYQPQTGMQPLSNYQRPGSAACQSMERACDCESRRMIPTIADQPALHDNQSDDVLPWKIKHC